MSAGVPMWGIVYGYSGSLPVLFDLQDVRRPQLGDEDVDNAAEEYQVHLSTESNVSAPG